MLLGAEAAGGGDKKGKGMEGIFGNDGKLVEIEDNGGNATVGNTEEGMVGKFVGRVGMEDDGGGRVPGIVGIDGLVGNPGIEGNPGMNGICKRRRWPAAEHISELIRAKSAMVKNVRK